MHEVRQHTRPYLDVVVVIGSFAQCLLWLIRRLFPGVVKVIVIDAHEELKRINGRHLSPDMQMFTLGLGHTAVTLGEAHGEPLKSFTRKVAGMHARDGAGQAPGIARAAMRDLIQNSDLSEYIQVTLANDLLIAANGPLLGINLHYIGTGNGGTYAGAVREFDENASAILRDATGAITTSRFWIAGPTVHRGLGPRIALNAASTAVRITEYVTNANAPATAIRAATLFELPGCGRDDERRNQILSVVIQASRAPSLLMEEIRVAPNKAVNGPFGNIELREFGFSRILDEQTEVAAPIAMQYGESLTGLQQQAVDPHVISQLELAHRELPQQQRSVEDILADGDSIPPEQVVDELCTPHCRRTVTVVAKITDDNPCTIEQLQVRWNRPVESLADFGGRLQQQRRLNEMLPELESSLAAECESLNDERDALARRLTVVHRRLYPQGMDYLKAALTSGRSKRRKLHRLANRLRQLGEQENRAVAELTAVRHANGLVLRELTENERKLGELIADLKSFAVRSASPVPYVAPQPIDEAFVGLWQAAADESALLEVIVSCVNHVTLDGLAAITGCDSCDLGAIAQQIVHGRCYVTAPIPWGNQTRTDAGLVVHVLPPLDVELKNSIQSACNTVDPKVNLAFGGTCAAGVCGVAIIVREAKQLKHIITSTTQAALLAALRSTYVTACFPEGSEVVSNVGLHVDGQTISFTS